MLSIHSFDRFCFGHPDAGEVSNGHRDQYIYIYIHIYIFNMEMLVGPVFMVQNVS